MKLWTGQADARAVTRVTPLAVRSSRGRARPALLVPLSRPTEAACGVLLVPEGLASAPRLDDAPLAPGLHVLAHGQALDCGARYWVSLDLTPREEPYTSARHGEDVFCARSKLRLVPGDTVVACPRCGLLYGARAWAAAPACHACRFDTKTASWAPPRPSSTPDLDELLRLLRA